jgi:hypothetical protein
LENGNGKYTGIADNPLRGDTRILNNRQFVVIEKKMWK